jgi:hypothetical protein
MSYATLHNVRHRAPILMIAALGTALSITGWYIVSGLEDRTSADFMITPRKRISDAVDDAARRPTAPRAPAVLDPIAAIAQSCAMSEVAAETAAEQGIRATCPATPMLSDA